MSDPLQHEMIQCPKCANRMEAPVVRVLQPGSAACKQLFTGKLNCSKCTKCGTAFQIEVEQLIFKDPETAFILVQTPLPDESQQEALEQEVDCMATDAAYQENLERPTVRLVFNREDFLEKIALHLRDLDDRLVEYAKFQLFQNTGGASLMPQLHRLLYDFSNSDEQKMQFIVFDRESGKPCASLHLPMQDFKDMVEEFEQNENLQKELERIFPNCFVQVDRLYE